MSLKSTVICLDCFHSCICKHIFIQLTLESQSFEDRLICEWGDIENEAVIVRQKTMRHFDVFAAMQVFFFLLQRKTFFQKDKYINVSEARHNPFVCYFHSTLSRSD